MHKVELEQGSPAWLAWRKGLLTATDAPMLLGASPYVTAYKGWQRKVGQAEEQIENAAMQRGKHDEPIARKWFNDNFGCVMEPCCIESDDNYFLGASLDGLSQCGKMSLEIKSNGDQYHNNLEEGIPAFHLMQMQHQFLASDNTIEKGYYVSYNKGDIKVKIISPDPDFFKDYIPKAKEFWRRVIYFDPPTMSNKDYRDRSNEFKWQSDSMRYKEICDEIAGLEEAKQAYRQQLLSQCNGESCMGCGIKILKKNVRGRIDYDSIPELYGMDLDKFRKASSESWMIMLE